MKFYSILRWISIACYSFIFLQGMMIMIPFILVLTLGIADAEPRTQPLRIIADLALIALAIINFKKKTRITLVLEFIIFFLLLSPLLQTLSIFPLQMFAYPLFIVPFAGFASLYPLSLLFSYLDYRQKQRTLESQIDDMDVLY